MATNLEMEAMNLVNDESFGPEVTDVDKYNQLLESRKNRKAVSLLLLHFHYKKGWKFIQFHGETN